MNHNVLKDCPFCKGTNTIIDTGTRIWLGERYGPPTHYEINHWCSDNRSFIKLKAKTEDEVVNKWNRV